VKVNPKSYEKTRSSGRKKSESIRKTRSHEVMHVVI